jgi:hypothetical protein
MISIRRSLVECRPIADTERNEIDQLFRKGMLNGEARRRIEREFDLREAYLLNHRPQDMKQTNALPHLVADQGAVFTTEDHKGRVP